MTALSDLLRDAKGDRSVDELITAAEKRLGHSIPSTFRSTAYKALDGDHAKRPREDTLKLFADVFNVDVRAVRRAANRPAGELGPWVPVSESAQLSQPVRTALDNLIKAIAQGGEAGESRDTPATIEPDSGPASSSDEDRPNNVTPMSPARSTVGDRKKRVAKKRPSSIEDDG